MMTVLRLKILAFCLRRLRQRISVSPIYHIRTIRLSLMYCIAQPTLRTGVRA